MQSGHHYVFGYGSLVRACAAAPDDPAAGLRPAVLTGYRRTWNVAMDNSQSIPGYKQYVDPATGARPPCFVVFLNIVADHGARVNGGLFQVSGTKLAELDHRERNYERIDVSALVREPVGGTVWTYVGSAPGVARYERARRANRAVISAGYYDGVQRAFAALGDDAVAEFARLTDPPGCPIVALRRISLAA